MNMTQWSPWNWFRKENGTSPARKSGGMDMLTPTMSQWRRDIERLFDDAFSGMPASFADTSTLPLLKPNLDIVENAEEYLVSVEIPGVSENDINVEVEGRLLVIHGVKKHEHEENKDNVHRVERSYGSFRRVLDLPDNADAEKVDARFKDGVLSLRIQKKADAETQTRKINIGS